MPSREKVEVIIGRRPGNEVVYAGALGQPANRADTVILIYGLGDEVKGRRRDFTDVSRINFDPETRQVVGGHARIIIKGDEVFIRDEGSSNGTWVNKGRGIEVGKKAERRGGHLGKEVREKNSLVEPEEKDWQAEVRECLTEKIIPELEKEEPDAELLFHTALDLLDFLGDLERQGKARLEEVSPGTIDLVLKILIKYSNEEQKREIARRLAKP